MSTARRGAEAFQPPALFGPENAGADIRKHYARMSLQLPLRKEIHHVLYNSIEGSASLL
jgi:hypothetical protein